MWAHMEDMEDHERILRAAIDHSRGMRDSAYSRDKQPEIVQALALTAIAGSLASIARMIHQGYTRP